MEQKVDKFINHLKSNQIAIFVFMIVVAVTTIWYLWSLTNRIVALEGDIASNKTLLEQSISETNAFLSDEINRGRESITFVEQELGNFKSEVAAVSGTVQSLEKLSKLDPELLLKYSKVFFLNENYIPISLTEISKNYKYDEDRGMQIHSDVWPSLEEMIEDAEDDGVEIFVFSSFRSFGEQGTLKGQYTITYGGDGANRFSADQGYSEHQLGTTVDFITTGIDGSLSGFEKTDAYDWLLKNAHKYGFTLSYPEGNGYYVFEPWHWRFVGTDLARHLLRNDLSFYDLEQREIDEYLISIFE